jgi:hypothetical protein
MKINANKGKRNRTHIISKIPKINPAIDIPLESSTIKPIIPKRIAAPGR